MVQLHDFPRMILINNLATTSFALTDASEPALPPPLSESPFLFSSKQLCDGHLSKSLPPSHDYCVSTPAIATFASAKPSGLSDLRLVGKNDEDRSSTAADAGSPGTRSASSGPKISDTEQGIREFLIAAKGEDEEGSGATSNEAGRSAGDAGGGVPDTSSLYIPIRPEGTLKKIDTMIEEIQGGKGGIADEEDRGAAIGTGILIQTNLQNKRGQTLQRQSNS
ncbi:unnamed protein product [Amoebophrya sp. A25]|nr:unnamed protein product [Amoebophrya sp. A25]|eukprot:GSA25T00026240001.1